MTLVAHIERCPLCNHRVLVRAKGTFTTHYRTSAWHQTPGNQCPGSRKTPAEAIDMALGVAAYQEPS